MVRFSQITSDYPIYPGQIDIERFPGVATDGVRVYFSDFQNGRVGLAYVLIGGGEVHRFVTPPEISRPSVADISRDGADLLIRSMMWSETEQPVWIAPSTGGSARRVFDVMAHDAAWTPDGKAILYASGQDLFLIERASGKSRKFATLSGRAYWMRYAPDGSIIRFTVLDSKTRNTSLWEISPTARIRIPYFPAGARPRRNAVETGTADGSYFVFQSAHGGRPNIWGLREPSFWRRRRPPFEITAGPLEFFAPVPSPEADQLFAIGANTRARTVPFQPGDPQSRTLLEQREKRATLGACAPLRGDRLDQQQGRHSLARESGRHGASAADWRSTGRFTWSDGRRMTAGCW